ncbi:hypothetical protein [Bacillus sp. UNC322MFChir4.1]|uniref:hypothetical protein n=1 Tax=Bacillus sp. UNC322MFChir4.1 TaxID=1449045 RepID=UPI0005500AF6|nr:hypothetical protein [Bacillus sp. UNC322MFChir4.1]
MRYEVLVKEIDSCIEEEIVVKIKDIELTGFANIFPYEIKIGGIYPVELSLWFLDDFAIDIQDSQEKQITKLGEGFKYELKGLLTSDGMFDIGIRIEDEILEDYEYLYGKYIKLIVDRINIEFL